MLVRFYMRGLIISLIPCGDVHMIHIRIDHTYYTNSVSRHPISGKSFVLTPFVQTIKSLK